MKQCFKCGIIKPLDEFYTHPAMADGYLGKCKSCARLDVQSNYARRRDQYREYDKIRAKRPQRKAAKCVYSLNHRTKNPEKRRARILLGSAIKCGRIHRKPCEVCGSANSEAHHPDYSKPLDVVWLCLKHHRELHKGAA